MKRPLSFISQTKLGSEQQPSNKQRRAIIGGGLAALAASPLLATPRRVMAQQPVNQVATPSDPFILLLKGLYQPVSAGKGPKNNLNLTSVNLSDGSYSETKIYPVWGIPNQEGVVDQDEAIGKFYVSLTTFKCAYDLPGGALAMQFQPAPAGAPPGYNGFVAFDDGKGGQYDEGTFELEILEATGIYSAFAGGHNHMVDRLHQLVAGPVFTNFPLSGYDEFCFCNISTYQFPS
jgi:hypothetical protein